MDDDFYFRHVMGNRFFAVANEHGEVDDYDHIMRCRQTQQYSGNHHQQSQQGRDLDDYDHRSLLQQEHASPPPPHETAAHTQHQPHSITAAEQVDIDDFDHRSMQIDPFAAEEVLAEQVLAVNVQEKVTFTRSMDEDVHGDVDDYDHRSFPNTPSLSQNEVDISGDVDDYDHRSLQAPPTTAAAHQAHQQQTPSFELEPRDVDDFDHRIVLDQSPPSTRQSESQFESSREEEGSGDVDDYDHRSLQESPCKDSQKRKKKLQLDIHDSDSRSKWALGNLSTKDIEQEMEARAKTKAEELAIKHKQDEIRHHAWE